MFMPMKEDDWSNGYPCVGIVVGKHYGYIEKNKYFQDPYGVATRYHMFSELMIGYNACLV